MVPLADPDPDSWRFIYGRWRGRVSRRAFWVYGVCIPLGLSLLGHALLAIGGADPRWAEPAVNIVLACPVLAVSAKRWQDRDRAAAWVLVALVPLVGWLWLLVDNGFVRGDTRVNRFGAPPLR